MSKTPMRTIHKLIGDVEDDTIKQLFVEIERELKSLNRHVLLKETKLVTSTGDAVIIQEEIPDQPDDPDIPIPGGGGRQEEG